MGEPQQTEPGLEQPRVLDRVVVVLYQPEDIINVASVVRVMTNFRVRHLRLVEPAAFDAYRIEGIAHGGQEVLAEARRFATLEEALADCGLALATTGRPRELPRPRLTPRDAARALAEAAATDAGAPAAIVFGRERDGLPNSAVDLCHALVTIPTDPAHHSLNLSHAAAIILYELHVLAAGAGGTAIAAQRGAHPNARRARTRAAGPAASGEAREEMLRALTELLEALHPQTSIPRRRAALARLRAVLLRAVPDAHEAQLLVHLFRHLARLARASARPVSPRR